MPAVTALCSGAAAGSRAETQWAHPVRHLAAHSHTILWVCLSPVLLFALYGVQIISSYLGPVTAITQEYGNTLATATMLAGTHSADNTTATARAIGIIRCCRPVAVAPACECCLHAC